MSPPAFVSARELSRTFYLDAVRPLLSDRPHAAGLLGFGSDVLGYDTERSTDHGWGPRLHLLLTGGGDSSEVDALLESELPEQILGWPVRFGWDAVPVSHHVTVTTLPDFLVDQLGLDATSGMSTIDWLSTPQQRLLGVVAGPVYEAGDGSLVRVREALAWYPDQVWRWLLACQWHRIAQEEAFAWRAAEVGDEIWLGCRRGSPRPGHDAPGAAAGPSVRAVPEVAGHRLRRDR